MFDVAVLFCTFNRLDTVKKSFARIRDIQPSRLYLSSDGPRDSFSGEIDKIMRVREYIEQNIDWECTVHKNYSDTNLGCGIKMSSAISWAFEHEDRLIIIEDDCVVDPSFFRYCEELLDYYKNDGRVMLIDGYCNAGKAITQDSYFFSAVPEDYWGWATWKRVWDKYEYDIVRSNERDILSYLKKITSRGGVKHFLQCFDTVSSHRTDIWDYQLLYMLVKEQGVAILPNTNLVFNAGIGDDATHTINTPTYYSSDSHQMAFPLKHPSTVESAKKYDKAIWKSSLVNEMIRFIKQFFGIDPNKSIFSKG